MGERGSQPAPRFACPSAPSRRSAQRAEPVAEHTERQSVLAGSRRTRDAPTIRLLLGRSLRLRRRCLCLRRRGFLHRRLGRGGGCFRSWLGRRLLGRCRFCCRPRRSFRGSRLLSSGFGCGFGRRLGCRLLGRRRLRRGFRWRCLLHCRLRDSLGCRRLLSRCCLRCRLCRRLGRRCFLHCSRGLRRDRFCGCFLCRCLGCRRFR